MARWNSWLPSGNPAAPTPAKPLPQLAELRDHLLGALHDCIGMEADRVRTRLMRAASVQELWLARCDAYRLIAREHCESIAAQRLTMSAPAAP